MRIPEILFTCLSINPRTTAWFSCQSHTVKPAIKGTPTKQITADKGQPHFPFFGFPRVPFIYRFDYNIRLFMSALYIQVCYNIRLFMCILCITSSCCSLNSSLSVLGSASSNSNCKNNIIIWKCAYINHEKWR